MFRGAAQGNATVPSKEAPEPNPVEDAPGWMEWARLKMRRLELVVEQNVKRIGDLNRQLLNVTCERDQVNVVIRGMEAIAVRRKSVEAWEVGSKVRIVDAEMDGTVSAIHIDRVGVRYDVYTQWHLGQRSLVRLVPSELRLVDDDVLPINPEGDK